MIFGSFIGMTYKDHQEAKLKKQSEKEIDGSSPEQVQLIEEQGTGLNTSRPNSSTDKV